MTFEKFIMEDALDAIIDYRGRTPEKSQIGIPTLSAKSVKNGQIDYSECYYISPEEYKKFMTRGFPQKGDILLTTEAPLGMVAKLDRTDVAVAQRLLTLRGKKGILDNDFLMYYLQSPEGQGLLIAKETGTTVTGIKQAEFRKIVIKVPNFQTQEKIAAILSALDEKIATNRAINDNLQQQARALYKDWFLDFSPFSSDGTLPEGWRIGTVGDIIQLHDSKRVPLSGTERSKMAKLYPYYGATSLMDYVDNYLFDGIYLLLGEDGTVVDNLGFPILQYVYGRFWVNNHAHIITGKEGFSVEELYLFFGLTNIKSIVTGAVQQKVSQQNLKKVPAIIPSSTALSSFNELIQPIFSQIRNLRDENARLTSLRDVLLPKLMSGEIDVSAVQL